MITLRIALFGNHLLKCNNFVLSLLKRIQQRIFPGPNSTPSKLPLALLSSVCVTPAPWKQIFWIRACINPRIGPTLRDSEKSASENCQLFHLWNIFIKVSGEVTQFNCFLLNTKIQWRCGDLNVDRISSYKITRFGSFITRNHLKIINVKIKDVMLYFVNVGVFIIIDKLRAQYIYFLNMQRLADTIIP